MLAGVPLEESSSLAVSLAQEHRADLERLLNNKTGVLLDNSFVSRFVKSRMHGACPGYTDAQLWAVETAFNRSMIAVVTPDIIMPAPALQEYERGITGMKQFSTRPLSGLRCRWQQDLACITKDVYERSTQAIAEFISTGSALAQTLQENLNNHDKRITLPYHRALCDAAIEVSSWGSITRNFGLRHGARNSPLQSNSVNDAVIYATALAKAYDCPVTLMTADSDFKRIHQTFTARLRYLSRRFQFPVLPLDNLTVVFDHTARTSDDLSVQPVHRATTDKYINCTYQQHA